MTQEELTQIRTDKLRHIITHAYKRSVALRERLGKSNLTPQQIQGIKDLQKIPVLAKEELVDLQGASPPFGGLLTVDPANLTRIFQSPGPIYDPQAGGGDYWRFGEALEAVGFGMNDLVINTFSYHLSPAGFMFDDGVRATGATVIPTGVGNTEIQVKIVHDLRVTGFVGTPSFLMALLNKAKELGLDFPIKKAFVTAEPFTPSQREYFDEHGIDVYQGYGTADVGAIAFECKAKEGMHVSSDLILEIVDANTGEQLPADRVGQVVVTIFNETYPLIRFGTGDLSKVLRDPCSCGLVSERIAGFMGRIGDAVKVRGMFVHPRQLAEVVASVAGLGDFVVEVTREHERDFLKLTVETEELVDSEDIRETLESRVKDILRVKVDKFEFVGMGTLLSEQKIIDRREWD